MKITETLGLSGFCLALLTFALTSWEKKKRLAIDMYCQNIEGVDLDNEFYTINNDTGEKRVVVIEVINQGNRSVTLDIGAIKININKQII